MTCTQQDELYAAEEMVPRGRRFYTVNEMQAWVDDLHESWWWKMWYAPVARAEVTQRDGRTNGSVGAWWPKQNAGCIEMLPCHWNERVVLHELAHVLAAARYGSKSHDLYFARVYLELVALVLGPEIYEALYTSVRHRGNRAPHRPG